MKAVNKGLALQSDVHWRGRGQVDWKKGEVSRKLNSLEGLKQEQDLGVDLGISLWPRVRVWGELLLERFQEADKSRPLGKGAGVFRTAGLVGGQQAVADGLYIEHGLGVLLVEHHRVFAYFVGFAHKAILFGLGLKQ